MSFFLYTNVEINAIVFCFLDSTIQKINDSGTKTFCLVLVPYVRKVCYKKKHIQAYNRWTLSVIYTLHYQKDTVVAEATRKSVQAEEAKASEKARFAGAIAADAQRDLDEALPALDAALTSLKSLNKNDVTEVRDCDDEDTLQIVLHC